MKISIIIITMCLSWIPHPSFSVSNPMCGPQSLLAICDYCNIDVKLSEICSYSDYSPNSGTSFYGLYNAAKIVGLKVSSKKLVINDLKKLDAPGIVFIDGNHFSVIHSVSNDFVVLQDFPKSPFKISLEDFEKRWSGNILIFANISSDKIPFFGKLKTKYLKYKREFISNKNKLEVPSILFEKLIHDFGLVNEGEKLSHIFKFTNIGTETLEVYARSTCGCTAALLSDKKIPPGDSGEIKITYNTSGRKGPTRQGADIRTNDPDNKWTRLTITATIKSSVKTVPEKIWLDEVVMGGEVQREILVIDLGDSTLKVESVEVPDGITAKILPEKTENNIISIPILLTINTGNKYGEFEENITIKTNDSVRPDIPVKITGIIIGEAKALPPVMFFGEIEPDTGVMLEVTISPTNGKRLEIAKVEVKSPYINTEVIPVENSPNYKLKATLKSPDKTTTVLDSIRVYVNGHDYPDLVIPLYARVVRREK